MMNSDQLRELADRLRPMAAAPQFDGLDIPALCDYLRQCADQRLSEPLQMLCATHYCKDCAALWRQHDDRSFSLCSQTYCMACNNTPIGGQLFALTTPVAAVPQPAQPQPEPSAAQIEARDALLDFISENGTASEGVQHYLDRYVRAALAAKDNGNAGE